MGQQVPLWVAVVIAVGTPLLAFTGVIVGHLLLRAGRTGAGRPDQPLVTAVLGAVLEPAVDDYREDDVVQEEE